MDRSHIDKIAQTGDDKMLLSKLWDKIQAGLRRDIPASTGFLSPREQEMARLLFGQYPGLYAFGGYEDAERKMLVYLPEYLAQDSLTEDSSPVICLRASFYREDMPTHRDFLGALTGLGIARECIGDICVGENSCDFFVTAEIAEFLLLNFTCAGRVKLKLSPIPLSAVQIPQPETEIIKDTLSSLRLDCIIASGFRMSRGLAAEAIAAGKVAIDGLPCEKPDRLISQGAKLSLRGKGKIKLESVGGQTKKGRTSVVIHRYL